jgi:hypothetical protein
MAAHRATTTMWTAWTLPISRSPPTTMRTMRASSILLSHPPPRRLPRMQVRKRPFLAIYTLKRSFYQDRLGTNIGKPLKKGDAFSCSGGRSFQPLQYPCACRGNAGAKRLRVVGGGAGTAGTHPAGMYIRYTSGRSTPYAWFVRALFL